MHIDEKKLLGLSFAVSLVLHVLIFSVFYFLNFKPFKKEEEKIITVSLDLPPLEEKPSVVKEAVKPVPPPPQPEKQPEPEKPPAVKPQPATQQQPQQQPQPQKPPPVASVSPQPSPPQENSQQPSQPQPAQPPASAQPQASAQPSSPPQKIDLTAGRQEQIKPPPKKDEDLDGYLKELIRYLNQQARERDLYPPIAKRLKIEGQVVVRVTINEDGTIEENSMTIVESSGYNVLDKGALDILRKLQPLKKPPKKITVEIPIVFQIIYM